MRAARRLLLTLLTAAVPLMGSALPAAAASGPTVTVAAPATVKGTVSVSAAGDLDPSEGDTALKMTLLVDGTQHGPAVDCASTGAHSCAVGFSWDTTGLNGSYTLVARMTTSVHPAGVDSSPLVVSAANPAASVAITSPTPNAVARGTLTVTATGTVDLSQTDTPGFLQLWVDGVKYGLPQPCTVVVTTTKTCTGSFAVVQPTWSGTHTVQVTMGTATTTASSATVPYFAYTAAKLFLSKVATVHTGKLAVLRGRAIAVTSGAPLVGARVAVTLVPATGKKHTVVVRTGATGRFSLATRLTVNTGVTVNVLASPGYGSSHGTLKAGVLAPIVCKADRTIRHGRIDAGTCTVAHLPDRTPLTLQYRAGTKWLKLGAGKNVGTTIPITFQFGKPGHYPVRLVLAANKAYVLTYGTPFVVTVT